MNKFKKLTRVSFLITIAFIQLSSPAIAQRDSINLTDSAKNQLSVIRLQTFFGNRNIQTSVTSLEYSRRMADKSILIGRVNYADRDVVNGYQFEAETYLNHGRKYYSFAGIGVSSNKVFPSFKGAYSLNRNFNKGWEGELGYRYLRVDEMDINTGIVGIGKYVGNTWLNLKGYLINDAGSWQQSYRFTSRFYMNDQLDYLTFIASTGTSPDDRSRVFENLDFGSFLSTSFALGYKKTFKNAFGVSLVGAWTNQKISDSDYLNQYDLYLTVLKKF